MKKLILLLLTALALPYFSTAQDNVVFELGYEINRVSPPVSISKEKLVEAQSLIDLDEYYKSSWVKEYIAVEILASHNGEIKKALSPNDILSQEQKDLMQTADLGTMITVNVQYLPDNNLKHNDIQKMDFTFMVDPETDAAYPYGNQQLKQYLKEQIIDKIPADSFTQYNLSAVNFTIDEEGQITNAQIYNTDLYDPEKDKKIDKILLETVCNMPKWKPAAYADGTNIKQHFVLTAGDHTSCIINLLNIRKYRLPKEE